MDIELKTDKDKMLYMALLIRKLKSSSYKTLSLMKEVKEEVATKIFSNHVCNIDDMQIFCDVVKDYFPEIYNSKISINDLEIKCWNYLKGKEV